MENGKVPFDDFVKTLDFKMKAKLVRDLSLLETFGNKLRSPYSSFVSDGIFELRTQNSGNIIRSLYFFYKGNKIVITNGFIKGNLQKLQRQNLIRIFKEVNVLGCLPFG